MGGFTRPPSDDGFHDYEEDAPDQSATPMMHPLFQSVQTQITALQKYQGKRPSNSYQNLMPFFGCTDKKAFKAHIDKTKAVYGAIRAGIETCIEAGLLGDNESTSPQFPSVIAVLQDALSKDGYSQNSITNPMATRTSSWSPSHWIARFVYIARGILFDDEDPASFSSGPVPRRLYNDRVYAVYLLFNKYHTETQTRLAAKSGSKAKPRKPKKAARQQKADVKGKGKATDGSGDVEMQDVDADDVFSSDAEEGPDDDDVVVPTTTSAADLRGSMGNDTSQNPWWRHFVRGANGTAHVIGSEHLLHVDADAEVDWEDQGRIDPKNNTSRLVVQYLQELWESDPMSAEAYYEHLKVIAKTDIFSKKHLALINGEEANPAADKNEIISGMFPADHVAEKRHKLLHQLTGYSRHNTYLQDLMQHSDVLAERNLADIHDSVAHEAGDGLETWSNETLVPIDTDDKEWRETQSTLLSAFTQGTITAETFRNALSKLHIAHRSHPTLPGQSERSLLWPQVLFIFAATVAARKRIMTGTGSAGLTCADATGIGKTIGALGTVLSVCKPSSFPLSFPILPTRHSVQSPGQIQPKSWNKPGACIT
jgi:hypothetical protein